MRAHMLLCLIGILITTLSYPTSTHAVFISQTRPRTANIFLPWNITTAHARALSQWDIIILDAEVGYAQPELLQRIRSQNKDIKIFAYVSSVELHPLTPELYEQSHTRTRLHKHISESSFLHRANGSRVTFWEPNHVVNITTDWKHILPTFIREEILSHDVWDGVMLDNVWNGITWYVGDVDINNDGISDDADTVNQNWNDAQQEIIQTIKRENPNKLVIANGNPIIYTELDGVVFENFPQHGWLQTIARMKTFASHKKTPPIFIINTTQSLDPTNTHIQLFSLGSSLLFDAYTSYSSSDTSHESLQRIPEYEKTYGAPRGAPYEIAPGVWRRDFTRTSVTVNYGLLYTILK